MFVIIDWFKFKNGGIKTLQRSKGTELKYVLVAQLVRAQVL